MTPPPGWYPDPHAPHLERWWDGSAWTGHRRTPEGDGPTPPAAGTYGPAGAPGAVGPGAGRARVVALTVAGAVLVAAITTGAVLLGGGDGGTPAAPAPATGTGPSATGAPAAPAPATTGPSTPAPTPPGPASGAPSVVADQLNGISFPLPEGWVPPEYVTDRTVVMTTDGTYDCPGGEGQCRHGLISSRAVASDGAGPEALARADIEEAAEAAYGRDRLGRRPFGGIRSHRETAAGPVAVAGRAGYYVRWRVTTAEGVGGYVQSLAFPSSVGAGSPVLVRFALDAGADGPPLTDIDAVTDGIRPLADADTGGGVGTGVGPPG